jgi:hypothetical protein
VRRALAVATARGWFCLSVLVAAGCGGGPPPGPDAAPPARPPSHFDPATAGTITGRVVWEGEPPAVPPFQVYCNPPFGQPFLSDDVRDNPNAPAVDGPSRGVADAVLVLRGVDPARARPWDLGPVRGVQRGGRVHVLQDGADSRAGFVRRGDAVTLTSEDPYFHSLRAAGAALLRERQREEGGPLERRLEANGYVELGSGAGYFWMRGHLFVDEHPYYARTDARGRFTLPGVPPGRYRLECWHPNWVEERHERDPETALISRLTFRPPVVREQEVEVAPRGTVAVRFGLSTSLFRP